MFYTKALILYVSDKPLLTTVYVLIICIAIYIYNWFLSRRQLPPGPIGLPIVGYLPFLGEEPHKDIAKLSQKYGNVFTLQMGVNNVVVLNDWHAVKEALEGDVCLGKPNESPTNIMSKTLSFGVESGSVWREDRNFAMRVFRELGFGTGRANDKVVEEIRHLIRHIDAANGHPLDICQLLTSSVSNTICQLIFGHRFEFNDRRRQLLDKSLAVMGELLSPLAMATVAPPWFSKFMRRFQSSDMKCLFKSVEDIFRTEITNHKLGLNNSGRDYISAYLEEMEIRRQKNPNTCFTDTKLYANCRSLIGAGAGTVRTTLVWILLYVSHYKEYQNKIHEELDSVVERKRLPNWSDKELMPFTQAFINEIFRFKTTIPLNLIRTSLEDTRISGHFIPKNTRIMANLWAVHNDPTIWTDPEQFNPYRFLTTDGKHVNNAAALIPFSMGKRSCAGESLARVELFLYLASLLQRYNITNTSDDKEMAFKERFAFTPLPKNRPILAFLKRF